jgi:hypothetical protein
VPHAESRSDAVTCAVVGHPATTQRDLRATARRELAA